MKKTGRVIMKSKLLFKRRNKYSERNLSLNKQYIFDGYIFGQSNHPISSMRYGCFNMSYNGCELIAVYNALKYLGFFKPLYEIISDFERKGYIWLDGVFGTKPQTVGRYLADNGLQVKRFYSAKEMDKAVKKDRCFIIIYAHLRGIHTVMARGIGENGEIAVLNRHNNSTREEIAASVTSLIKTDGIKMIVGYLVG